MRSRRRFIRDTGIVAGGTLAFPTILRAEAGRVAQSDQIRVAVIGGNGMGYSDLTSILKVPEVECGGSLGEGTRTQGRHRSAHLRTRSRSSER